MKKIVAFLITAILLFGVALAEDVSDWATDDVDRARTVGLIRTDGYSYTQPIIRGNFAELIFNYVTGVAKIEIDTKPTARFTDTNATEILALAELGVVQGKSETEFAPNDYLTREEAASILRRLVNVNGELISDNNDACIFADAESISPWAADDVSYICSTGVMQGVGNDNFAPQDVFTVEEAVVTIMRIYDKLEVEALTFADKMNNLMPNNVNYMFSPLSIKMILALVANGAQGETRSEILSSLDIDDLDVFNQNSVDLIEKSAKCEMPRLNIANSIWTIEKSDKDTLYFNDTFKNSAMDFYHAEVKTVNEAVAVEGINSWVNDKTNGKIQKVINNVDQMDSVLINAVYFNGKWENEFDKNYTYKEPFTNADDTTVEVDFMHNIFRTWFKNGINAKIVKLPYKTDSNSNADGKTMSVSMYAILPKSNINPVDEVERALVNSEFVSGRVDLALPKFKFEYSIELNDILKELGINKAFSEDEANFSGMVDGGKMCITDTVHKTFIDVNEKETEAAAVTVVGVGGVGSVPEEPVRISFDRPFYFVIRDDVTGEPLFVGRYAFAK